MYGREVRIQLHISHLSEFLHFSIPVHTGHKGLLAPLHASPPQLEELRRVIRGNLQRERGESEERSREGAGQRRGAGAGGGRRCMCPCCHPIAARQSAEWEAGARPPLHRTAPNMSHTRACRTSCPKVWTFPTSPHLELGCGPGRAGRLVLEGRLHVLPCLRQQEGVNPVSLIRGGTAIGLRAGSVRGG